MNIKNKKANPKISVIITCYNYGEFIDEAIQSVQNQTFKDYELIIIDDCSTDKFTKEIIKKISIKKYHTFLSSKVIQLKKNAGVAKARNLAIKKAGGKYILCLDADDKLHKACLQEMYDIIEQEQYDIVGAGHKEFGYKPVKKAHIRQYFKYKFCTDCQITISSLFKKKEAEKKQEEAKKEEQKAPETKKETAKKAEKEEIKELKKEMPKQQMPKPMAAPKQVEQHPTAPKGQ